MKVLFINTGHSRGGGAFTVYLSVAEMLRKEGIEVIHFALHSSNELPCKQSVFFAKEISQSNPFDYVIKRFYNRDAAKCLQRLIDEERPDIAHAHLIWGGLAPSILDVLKKNHIPVVHTVHDHIMLCSRVVLQGADGKVCERCSGGHYYQSVKTRCHHGSFIRSLIAAYEIAYRNRKHHPVGLIDYFMFVSEFSRDKHFEMDNRFVDVPNSVFYNVPDSEVEELSKGIEPHTYNSYYLYYGRLSREKGLNTLLDVFFKRRDLLLKIVGTGPLEKDLKEKCYKEQASNVEFCGFKTGTGLYRMVQEAKFVCVPSECYENNPMTVVEGYTLGTPIIASRIGGIPEIVEEEITGFLFTPASEDDFLNVLNKCEKLSEKEYGEMKRAAKTFASENFNRELYVHNLVSLYNDLCNKNTK